MFPALAYRFDTPGGSVVFSGDTGPCDNVRRLAAGADVLVHEAIDLEWMAERVNHLPNRDAVMGHLGRAHCPPEDAGRIAAQAGVRTLVLSHLVPGDDDVPAEQWERGCAPLRRRGALRGRSRRAPSGGVTHLPSLRPAKEVE